MTVPWFFLSFTASQFGCLHSHLKGQSCLSNQVDKYHPTLPLFINYYDSSVLCNVLHFFVYSLTWMLNSIRPNTDCHKAPQKHLFLEESHTQDIWIPSSLSILLSNYHSSIAVTCNILWSPSQKFICQVECIWTTGQEGRFGKENKQDLYLLKDPCLNCVTSKCPELDYFNCRTEISRHVKPVHSVSTVEEPTRGKTELWVCLGSPDCSGPNTLTLSPSVWVPPGPALHQGAGTTKHETIFKRNRTMYF